MQRTYAAGQAKILAYLDDYAFLTDGLIALYQATGETRWLRAAGELTETEIALFGDEQVGGFFYTSTQHEPLIARSKLPHGQRYALRILAVGRQSALVGDGARPT